jgi:hypothetical protein
VGGAVGVSGRANDREPATNRSEAKVPTIRRAPVPEIHDNVLDAHPIGEKAEEYPSLTDDDVRACRAYGACLVAGRFVEIV